MDYINLTVYDQYGATQTTYARVQNSDECNMGLCPILDGYVDKIEYDCTNGGNGNINYNEYGFINTNIQEAGSIFGTYYYIYLQFSNDKEPTYRFINSEYYQCSYSTQDTTGWSAKTIRFAKNEYVVPEFYKFPSSKDMGYDVVNGLYYIIAYNCLRRDVGTLMAEDSVQVIDKDTMFQLDFQSVPTG